MGTDLVCYRKVVSSLDLLHSRYCCYYFYYYYYCCHYYYYYYYYYLYYHHDYSLPDIHWPSTLHKSNIV